MSDLTRRRMLLAAGSAGILAASGCLGEDADGQVTFDDDDAAVTANGADDSPAATSAEGPPVVNRMLPQDYTIDELTDASQSGGPPPDGIPSIDSPNFNDADNPPASVEDQSPVFGVEINGDARAYPQIILVWHEIVNDVVGDEPVSVTYCPLTGTAQGFYRGDVEFGVSGQLINTNLVMFDRTTESWWPQILAWGIRGPHEGDYLEEFQVVWTTWERWREAHPETSILNEDTGSARNYGNDPYGSYMSESGYYVNESTLFPPLSTDDRFPPKEVVIGMRNEDGAMCVRKEQLREEQIIEGTLNDVNYVSVYDAELDTGYTFRNPDGVSVSESGNQYTVEGSTYDADDLPLDREIAFDAMWLAWFGYYPSTVVHE